MSENTSNPSQAQNQPTAQAQKPNECGTVSVQAHLKIFDPNSKTVYLEGRA